MASNSERGVHPSKGLSFIDWESLDEEEYVKLNRIINAPHQGSSVQFPFPRGTDQSVSSKQQQGVSHAPVFQPSVPPPSMVGFPIPVHWPPGNPGLASHGGGPYPITMHSGYVFPNPALSAGHEGTVAFVTAISNGHPMYAIPGVGHPISAHFQGAPIPPREGMPLTVPITAHGNETVMATMPAGQGVLPPHTLPPVPSHIALGEPGAVPVTLAQAGVQMPLTQPPVVPVTLTQSGVPVTLTQPPVMPVTLTQPPGVPTSLPPPPVPMTPQAPQPQMVCIPTSQEDPQPAMPEESCKEAKQPSAPSPQPPAVTGLPIKPQASSIEFGGPVVYKHHTDTRAQTEPNNNKFTTPEKTGVAQEVVIDIENLNTSESNLPSANNIPGGIKAVAPCPTAAARASAGAQNDTRETPAVSSPNGSVEKSLKTADAASSVPPPSPVPQQTVKSWSSLFATKSQGVKTSSVNSVNNTVSQPLSNIDAASFPAIGDTQKEEASSKGEKPQYVPLEKVTAVGVHSDPLAHRIQSQLSDLQIIHAPIVIQPRGLKNGQNTCFLNAPLQVLMGCPPFVHMFRSFKHLPTRAGSQSSTPILDSLVQFVNSFQNGQRMRNPGSRNKKGGNLDLNVGQPFIPHPLLSVAQNILGLHMGVQHDAEEFLSQILSICHEEMENILHMGDTNGLKKQGEVAVNGNDNSQESLKSMDEEEDSDEAWQQVGPRNHHVETNVNDCGQTPLSSIFAGLSRSCLVRESGKSSDTLDSFFTLKLDIQAEPVHSVKDALLRLNTTETVHDADGRRVHGQRRMFFDVLPPVLIMHLKLFEYSNGNGQKIQKKVTFDVDLQIPKEIISRVGKTKYASPKSRNYKLFGVVNHHGRKMNDGHYTSDVFLPVASGWLRFDDSEIVPIQEADVLYYSDRSMPYLLFYRRMDVA
ncbi:ubiquitin carboxyl-terminal hydrolase 10 [Aplysia californica]|uniref:ubiquitinyl hydrolase 1 n=1 Tax=Aplysia californica TaxID=6500 RepID=A0ABM0JDR8_APLCA|nr:ubiquitin carboxyl-terminal hydrolase 10 [Aplysia californica]